MGTRQMFYESHLYKKMALSWAKESNPNPAATRLLIDLNLKEFRCRLRESNSDVLQERWEKLQEGFHLAVVSGKLEMRRNGIIRVPERIRSQYNYRALMRSEEVQEFFKKYPMGELSSEIAAKLLGYYLGGTWRSAANEGDTGTWYTLLLATKDIIKGEREA